MKTLTAALGLALLALSATSAAMAQSWPQKPIKVIAPYPPGGPSDLVMRTAAEFLPAEGVGADDEHIEGSLHLGNAR